MSNEKLGIIGGTPAPDLNNNPSECFAPTSLYTREAQKVRIYAIFEATNQSEILFLLFIRAKRNGCGCPALNFYFLFLIFYLFSARLVR